VAGFLTQFLFRLAEYRSACWTDEGNKE